MEYEQDQISVNASLSQVIERLEIVATLICDTEEKLPHLPVIENMHQAGKIAERTVKKLGLSAVRQNLMTRREVAGIIGVHPLTISRWLTAAAVEAPEESNRNYPPVT